MNIHKNIEIVYWIHYPIYIEHYFFPTNRWRNKYYEIS
jgi:hypothetical protein